MYIKKHHKCQRNHALQKQIQGSGTDLLSPSRFAKSTMGPGGLSDRVRNGNGCDPSGRRTRTLDPFMVRRRKSILVVAIDDRLVRLGSRALASTRLSLRTTSPYGPYTYRLSTL